MSVILILGQCHDQVEEQMLHSLVDNRLSKVEFQEIQLDRNE